MTGAGFKCDQCGHLVIVPVAPSHRPSPGEVPAGWFYLAGPQPATRADGTYSATPSLHLCSTGCVAGWSHNALAATAAPAEVQS